jgi:hypothetical protein
MRTYRTVWLVLCVALAAAGIAAASMAAPAALCVLFSCAAVVVVAAGWWTAPPRAGGRLDAVARAFAYAGTPYAPLPAYLDLHLFTDEQLCEAWRGSHPGRLKDASVQDTMCALEERQTYLDELARRHPEEFATWLASQPDAADDPLTRRADLSGDRRRIDWDELITGQDW